MFLLDDGQTVLSPSDLRAAAVCEFALLRDVDVALGRAPRTDRHDPLLERTVTLGNEHEQRVLRALVDTHRGGVVQIPAPARRSREALAEARDATLQALRSDAAQVVYQGVFFDGGFLGYADFIVREGDTWTVCDTKLARSESVPALLQIAAYAAHLRAAGVPTSPVARLILGSGVERDFPLDDILPVYRERRRRLEQVVATHRADAGPVLWGDERWLACGRCETCTEELRAARDVLLVAGCRLPQRRKLLDAGVATVEDLARREEPVPGLSDSTQRRLRAQAQLQAQQDADPLGVVRSEVHDPAGLAVLPAPSPGDIFFDFEGDPMWTEGGSDWGLEYLFGIVEAPVAPGAKAEFRAFWAHDREQERQALIDFVAYLTERRRRWPDLHVYHYAAYERSALLRLAARHGVCEEEIDQLLREGVLVDLYAVVRSAVRVSQPSYSIKKLEPLYMGDDLRAGDVTTAGESIVVYHEYSQAVDAEQWDRARAKLEDIRSYNEYDCLSTLRLRDWLLAQAVEAGVPTPGSEAARLLAASTEREVAVAEPHPLEQALRAHVDGVKPHERTADQQAVAMVAAAVQFHRREDKPFWWDHFDRFRAPVDEWRGLADVLVVDSGEVKEDWAKTAPRQRQQRRTLTLVGQPDTGGALRPGAKVQAVYDKPCPPGVEVADDQLRAPSRATVTVEEVTVGADGRVTARVEELEPKGGCAHPELPMALVPVDVVNTTRIDGALEEVASGVLGGLPDLPASAALDVLRRLPPRLRSGGGLPAVGQGPGRYVDAITAAVLDLDDSYVAVQGPPGTGKTWVGARVIARLVLDHGWRVGVCAQSHKAIENVLAATVKAGVPAELVGKVAKESDDPEWTAIDDLHRFLRGRAGGLVVGGTAWDLCHTGRVDRRELDLLVIDEAGQYSLAKTLACAVSASRLLLLGDPQQLPQVSQGSHPDPVDASALGWLIGDSATLPATHGYFLETTWRMHPRLTERVSRLSYAGQLTSHEPVTAVRRLAGIEPGLHVVRVQHRDNATESREEAAEVLARVEDLLGREWDAPDERDPAGQPVGPRPLGEADICVVTPYNAQADLIRRVLTDAGHSGVPVGTVDKFQGQEAPVVIISMAASAHADVSRGMAFLLDRNRLNVAVSRGKWAAYLVRSDVLTDFAPRSSTELLSLGAFIGLCDGAG